MRATRLKEEHAPTLLAEFADGEPTPGSCLTETWVAERFAISRGSAREVIRTLELCDAVEVVHGRGAIVLPACRWNPLIPMVIRARIESIDGAAVAKAYFEYARYFVVIVAMSVVSRGETQVLAGVAAELARLAEAPEPLSGAAVDARLLRAWSDGFHDPMRVHVGSALSRGLEIAVERIPELGGEREASCGSSGCCTGRSRVTTERCCWACSAVCSRRRPQTSYDRFSVMARLHREMMDELTEEIVSGRLEPGQMLPREADLATRFGVSRGVAREGIRAMEERGLISVRHGKGATVSPPSSWNTLDPDVLRPLLAGPYSVGVLEGYMECRRILEVEAADLAAERATDDDLDAMSRALDDMQQLAEQPASHATEERFHEADIAFHQAMIGGTRNGALCSLTESIHAAVLAARFWLARPEYRMERAMPEHRAIFAAVAAHDRTAAREAMARHLSTIESYITAHNGASTGADPLSARRR